MNAFILKITDVVSYLKEILQYSVTDKKQNLVAWLQMSQLCLSWNLHDLYPEPSIHQSQTCTGTEVCSHAKTK